VKGQRPCRLDHADLCDPAEFRSRCSTLRGWRPSQWSTGPCVCSARVELATSAFGERCSSWLSYEHVRPEGFEPSSSALEVRLPSNRRGRVSTWGRTRTCGEMLNRHPRCRFATHVKSPPPESNRVSAVYKTAASPPMLDGRARPRRSLRRLEDALMRSRISRGYQRDAEASFFGAPCESRTRLTGLEDRVLTARTTVRAAGCRGIEPRWPDLESSAITRSPPRA
jgi:hypothetical protein